MQPIAPCQILASRNLSPQITRHRQEFENDGFVVLPRFFDDATIAEVLACIEQVKHDRPMDVVVDDLATGARSVLGLLSPRQVAAPG